MLRPLRPGPVCWTLIAGGIMLSSTARLSADYPTAVLNDQPRGYWRLNDDKGNIAINRGTAGDAWTAKIHGGDWLPSGPTRLIDGTELEGMGVDPGAVYLGATQAYLSVDQPVLSNLTQFTVSGWIHSPPLESDQVDLWGQDGVVEFSFSQPNRLELWTARGGSLTWNFEPDQVLSLDGWTLLSATGDGNQLRLYVNAELVATGGSPIVGSYGASGLPFRVSGGEVVHPESQRQFPGFVSELAVWDRALSAQRLEAHLQSAIGDNLPGDFNGDRQIGLTDVNMLIDAIVDGSADTLYDVNGSDAVDEDDLYHWVAIIKNTWIGDADLDGEFNSTDFVQVFQRGEYEDALPGNSGWDDGDWNADANFTSDDFIAAFADGGYELGPRAVPAVPEPASGWLLLTAASWLSLAGRRAIAR